MQDTKPMRDGICFILNGEVVDVHAVDPTTTLLRWLRETRRLVGTKEGCAAGDCGACTVVVGHAAREGGVQYRAVNACLLLLPMLDGKIVVTIEHLARDAATLHPVQQALVDCHGSQCGFCTPGFVMAMAARTWERSHCSADLDLHAIDDALAGNLCRCTGYAPIRKAMVHASANARPAWDIARRQADEAQLVTVQDDRVAVLEHASTRAYVPATFSQFAALALAHPDATIVAGATDVGLWINKQHRPLATIIVTSRLSDPVFNGIGEGWIGGGVTHADAMAGCALIFGEAANPMQELWRRFAGPQVRNTGTVGGNIANGSPIGDLAPALIALGATLHLQRGETVRELLLEDYFIGYGKQDRRPGEFILGVRFPASECGAFTVHKVTKRFDDDISAVCGAFNIVVNNGVIASAHLAFGGMAATPKRATTVEAALIGKSWTRATIDASLPAFALDFTPLSDMRASAAYRLEVARNLLVRTFIEATEREVPTRLTGPPALVGS